MSHRSSIGLALALAVLAGCPHSTVARPYPAPAAKEILDHLAGLRGRATSLNAETQTDVRLGKERANVKVDILGTWGGKLRFLAHDPNDSTAADLASDGKNYCLLDVHANCGECGPATPETVASLVHIPLEPDEVVAVLLGTAPVIVGEAEESWDPSEGHEVLTIHGAGATERLVLDGKDRRWDLLEATLTREGKTAWSVRHKDFHDVTTLDSKKVVRLPGASLFEGSGDTVRILWGEQRVGEPMGDARFHIALPAGLRDCRQK